MFCRLLRVASVLPVYQKVHHNLTRHTYNIILLRGNGWTRDLGGVCEVCTEVTSGFQGQSPGRKWELSRLKADN